MAREHPHSLQYLAQQMANSREIVANSRKLLAGSKRDTFAGRKTQEPFPVDDDPMERSDIQNLINSELQPPEE